MQDDDHPQRRADAERPGVFAMLLRGLIRDTTGLWATFLIGTGVGAVLCLYSGAPLVLSLLGGVLVLAVYVAWDRL